MVQRQTSLGWNFGQDSDVDEFSGGQAVQGHFQGNGPCSLVDPSVRLESWKEKDELLLDEEIVNSNELRHIQENNWGYLIIFRSNLYTYLQGSDFVDGEGCVPLSQVFHKSSPPINAKRSRGSVGVGIFLILISGQRRQR